MREDRGDENYQPELPPLECGEYLIGYLWEVGPTLPGGMGPAPVTHGEIAAWLALVGLRIEPWEARLLRRLSREYVQELHLATKPDRPAPWQPTDYEPDFSGAVKAMRRAFAKLDRL